LIDYFFASVIEDKLIEFFYPEAISLGKASKFWVPALHKEKNHWII
jgi:hypothetical protein